MVKADVKAIWGTMNDIEATINRLDETQKEKKKCGKHFSEFMTGDLEQVQNKDQFSKAVLQGVEAVGLTDSDVLVEECKALSRYLCARGEPNEEKFRKLQDNVVMTFWSLYAKDWVIFERELLDTSTTLLRYMQSAVKILKAEIKDRRRSGKKGSDPETEEEEQE